MIKYCKYCKWYIKYLKAFNGIKDGEDGRNICGATMGYTRNAIGQKVLKTYGDVQECDECGTVLHDNREIKYQKCITRNKKKDCPDFTPRWFLKLLRRKFYDK